MNCAIAFSVGLIVGAMIGAVLMGICAAGHDRSEDDESRR